MPTPRPQIATLVVLVTGLFLSHSTLTATSGEAERTWTQERIAYDAAGQAIEPLRVNAAELEGLVQHWYRLEDGARLEVHTDLEGARARGLDEVASVIGRSRRHVANVLGRKPRGDVLLYLIEVEEAPRSFRFEATGRRNSRFAEIRLVWIPRQASLRVSAPPSVPHRRRPPVAPPR